LSERIGRLPWRTKFGYGSAELGLVAVEVHLEIYLLKFYNVVIGLPAHYTGIALGIAILWDAVCDVVMGWISDRTRSPMGRRRPYLLPGGIGMAFCFILLYNPPALDGVPFKFAYLLISYILLTTTMTVIGVPHIALGGEMSFDRHERTEIFAARRVFSTLGLFVGTLVPVLLLRHVGDSLESSREGYSRSLSAVILALPIVATSIIALRATRGLDHSDPAPSFRITPDPGGLRALFRAQRGVLANKVFLPILLAFIISGIGRSLNASMALYYYEYRLGMTERQVVLMVFFPFFASILLAIPFWMRVSRRFGKKWPAFGGMLGLALLTGVIYAVLPPNRLLGPVLAAVAGGLLAASIVLFESLVADTVDYDEMKTGRNREGLYFGVWKMATKVSRAIGFGVSGLLLGWVGFNERSAAQDPEVGRRLALLFGPGVGIFFLLGVLCFLFFPMTSGKHERIQEIVRRRRARRSAGA
jgi:Na+/melibiose symporter-like transporter